MSSEMTKFKNEEPLEDYRLQAIFQRKLDKQPDAVKFKLKSMGKCCRKMIPRNQIGGVALLGTRDKTKSLAGGQKYHRTGFHGTCKCNNIWACPVCSARLLTEKARALTIYLAYFSRQYKAFMVTYTIPHTRKMSADFVIKKFSEIRRQAFHGTVERFQKNVLKCIGTVTTSEVTRGPYGWHLHQHVLYVVPRSSWQHVDEFCRRCTAGWNGALIMTFPDFRPGKYKSGAAVHVSKNKNGKVLNVTDGRYLFGYGSELSKSRRGKAHGYRSRTLFDLIDGTDEEFDLLCEWLLASRQKHRITISSGIKRPLDKLAFEKKILAASTIETDVVGLFGASDWHNLIEAEIVTGRPLRYGAAKAALYGYESVVKFLARDCPNVHFSPPTRVLSPITGTTTEESHAVDDSVIARLKDFASRTKDARIHEDILALMADDEAKRRLIEEYQRRTGAAVRNSASAG